MPVLLVTGSSGLIGSEVVSFFAAQGWKVFGIDNNERARFFGPDGDTRWNQARLAAAHQTFEHIELDIRDRDGMLACIARVRPDLVVHAAAQPSHDLAASRPFEDFDVNAGGTLNILEAIRRHAPDAVYVHLSTNKVYGDAPNEHPAARARDALGLRRSGIRQRHRRDVPHRSVEALAVRRVEGGGRHDGAGVRPLLRPEVLLPARRLPDRAGALGRRAARIPELPGPDATSRSAPTRSTATRASRSATTFTRSTWRASSPAFFERPRSAEVYNMGGGRANSCSILEAFAAVERLTGKPMRHEYVDTNRQGDHICYISDLTKLRAALSRVGRHGAAGPDLRGDRGRLAAARRARVPDPGEQLAGRVAHGRSRADSRASPIVSRASCRRSTGRAGLARLVEPGRVVDTSAKSTARRAPRGSRCTRRTALPSTASDADS